MLVVLKDVDRLNSPGQGWVAVKEATEGLLAGGDAAGQVFLDVLAHRDVLVGGGRGKTQHLKVFKALVQQEGTGMVQENQFFYYLEEEIALILAGRED